MTKYDTFKEIILKNMSISEFKEKSRIDCSIETDQERFIFKWENFSEQKISYINTEKQPQNRKIYCIDAIISSKKNDSIERRTVKVTLVEKESNLVLIIKGNTEVQTKIKSKLLGQHTSNLLVKELWRDIEILLPEKNISINFLLWLIDLYSKEEIINFQNLKCKIIGITYISDEGVYLSGIRKKGAGNKLTDDPIIKATIATVDTIDAIGLKINFGCGMVNFILHNNGEIDMNSESYINLPISFEYSDLFGAERIVFFIKEILIENLKKIYRKNIAQNKNYFSEIKYQFLLKTIDDFGEILKIEVSNTVAKNKNVSQIILK